MELKQYIESGILESFVLGELSEKEMAEVLRLASEYPEIKTAISDLETALEKTGFANRIEPPAELQNKIMNAIFSSENIQKSSDTELLVRKNKFTFWKAAAIILIATSAGFNVWLYKKWNDSKTRIASLEQDQVYLSSLNTHYKSEVKSLTLKTKILNNPEFSKILLNGTEKFKGGTADIYLNKISGDIYVEMPFDTLSWPLSSEEDLQLWAIIDGKPENRGVINKSGFLIYQGKMKLEVKPTAFAITVEPKGGSETPTLNMMILSGKV